MLENFDLYSYIFTLGVKITIGGEAVCELIAGISRKNAQYQREMMRKLLQSIIFGIMEKPELLIQKF